jgi:hypothetical protein
MFIPPLPEGQQQLQLELPDYSEQYYRWIERQKSQETPQDTVIIIDLY